MYKYVKGTTVLSEERLLDSSEIAEEYNFYMPLQKDTYSNLIPNGILIELIISAFREKHNYKTSDYYYISDNNVATKVYQDTIVTAAIQEFMDELKGQGINLENDHNYELVFEGNIKISFYYYENHREAEIIDFNELKNRRKDTKND